jgi:hypothetical protein
MATCKADNCDSQIQIKDYCSRHYQQVWKFGYVKKHTQRDTREPIIDGEIAMIPIGVGAKNGYAIVDKDDAYLSKHKWHLANGYAEAKINKKPTKMHIIIANPEHGKVVDHKNGNIIDNRKQNLRECLQAENLCNAKLRKDNKLGVKGVYMHQGGYRAVVAKDKIRYDLGVFKNLEDARIAWEEKAKILHGEFVRVA